MTIDTRNDFPGDGIAIDDYARVLFSVTGVIKFDAQAVAEALRTRHLSRLEAEGLANLIEGKHPTGLRLAIGGQGKGWKSIYEGAGKYDRLLKVGSFVEAKISEGNSVEEAVLDAAAKYKISEPTVYRDLKLYRLRSRAD